MSFQPNTFQHNAFQTGLNLILRGTREFFLTIKRSMSDVLSIENTFSGTVSINRSMFSILPIIRTVSDILTIKRSNK